MSYSLRDDVEQLKRNMAQLHVDMQYNDSCQGWNQEMTDIVNEYKREEAAWYNSPQITENGFQTTTQESVDGGPARTRQTLEKIRSVDPHFSEETFIGNLSNKLMSICYAESDAQIRPFVECDVMPFMATHRNIMDCKMIECVLMDYQTVEDYQYLNVNAKIGLTTYNNGRAFKTEAHLRMGLVKSIRAVTQSISDVNVYRCTSCGGSLSLLNGGRCEYCGNCLDLKEYDWVIERFEDITGKRAADK